MAKLKLRTIEKHRESNKRVPARKQSPNTINNNTTKNKDSTTNRCRKSKTQDAGLKTQNTPLDIFKFLYNRSE